MDNTQFDRLAMLAKVHKGSKPSEAVRLRLVFGVRPTDAAQQAGTTKAGATNCLSRMRNAYYLAHEIAGVQPKEHI
jgi:hypothetical protein